MTVSSGRTLVLDLRDATRDLYRSIIENDIIPEREQRHLTDRERNFVLQELTRQFFDIFTWDFKELQARVIELPRLKYFEHIAGYDYVFLNPVFKRDLENFFMAIVQAIIEEIGFKTELDLFYGAINIDHLVIMERVKP